MNTSPSTLIPAVRGIAIAFFGTSCEGSGQRPIASTPKASLSLERNRRCKAPPAAELIDANALRGKVVAIDFWTYTCINWMRTAPYLRT